MCTYQEILRITSESKLHNGCGGDLKFVSKFSSVEECSFPEMPNYAKKKTDKISTLVFHFNFLKILSLPGPKPVVLIAMRVKGNFCERK